MISLLQGSVSRVRRLPVVSCLFCVVLAFEIIADFLVLSVKVIQKFLVVDMPSWSGLT